MNIETRLTLDRFEHKKRILNIWIKHYVIQCYLIIPASHRRIHMLEPYSNTIIYTKKYSSCNYIMQLF